jgi:hypothetical protein
MKMKSYLLLFLSSEQSQLTKSCSKNKFALKRTCQKKCIKHQTHSEQQGTANLVTECGQQVYAVLSASDYNISYSKLVEQAHIVKLDRNHLHPDLATDPDPPQFS